MPDEPSSTDLSSLPQVDQEAIGATLLNLMAGFQERNVDKLADIYSSTPTGSMPSVRSRREVTRSSSIFAGSLPTTTSTQGH